MTESSRPVGSLRPDSRLYLVGIDNPFNALDLRQSSLILNPQAGCLASTITERMSLAAESFTENVISFCKWVEGSKHTLTESRQHILTLMFSIPYLESFRGAYETDEEHEHRGHEGWKADLERFNDLPFDHYQTMFNPHDLTEEEKPVMGSLRDDLADIYGDLFEGLSAYKKGYRKEAIGIWIQSYFFHWGQHASSALNAIDHLYRENQGCDPGDRINSVTSLRDSTS